MSHTAPLLQLLIVEDDENDVILLQKELRSGGLQFESRVVDSQPAFVRALDEFNPDLIIADFRLPRFDALTALELTQSRSRKIPFIVFTGALDEETALLCLKLGAWDCILKQHPARLVPCLRGALERKRLVEEKELAQRESEQRFRHFADLAPALVWMTDSGGRPQFFNRAWQEFTGRSRDAEQPEAWLEAVHPDDRDRCAETLRDRVATLQTCRLEFRLRRHDGVHRRVLCQAAPFYTQRETFGGYVASAVEVVEAGTGAPGGNGEAALASALAQVPVPLWVRDRSGRVVAASAEIAALLGRSVTELAQIDLAAFGVEAAAAVEAARAPLLNGEATVAHGELPHPRDASRVLGFQLSPWQAGDGTVAGTVETFRDPAALCADRGATSALRHELNNHLSIVRMYAEFLAESLPADSPFPARAREIVKAADQMAQVIRRALPGTARPPVSTE
jgi:PAS domain S-box-containing protein